MVAASRRARDPQAAIKRSQACLRVRSDAGLERLLIPGARSDRPLKRGDAAGRRSTEAGPGGFGVKGESEGAAGQLRDLRPGERQPPQASKLLRQGHSEEGGVVRCW